MNYFMHENASLSLKLEDRVRKYFNSIKTVEVDIVFNNKEYRAVIDVESFLHPTNFDCFNCLVNCCVQFPYDFNKKARDLIVDNIWEYDSLTKAVSILKEEGMTEKEIVESIRKDRVLIPEEYVNKTFDRCTCSAVYVDRSICALHKMCLDKGFSLKETIATKPLWCSVYPLEIIEDKGRLLIFVPTKKNNYLSMNDSKFPCMDIEISRSPYFRRENPIGFKESEYETYFKSQYSILSCLFGEEFVKKIRDFIEVTEIKIDEKKQYMKKL